VATTTCVHDLERALGDIHHPFTLAVEPGAAHIPALNGHGPTAHVPACRLEYLGDPGFCADLGIRYPYLAGAMANGIGSADIVEAMGLAGMLAFFGAAGLPVQTVEAAIDRISKNLGDTPYGFNLIHSPGEPALERAVV